MWDTTLATILPKGQRLQSIKLIANWFDSHRVIGPILTKVRDYKVASLCRYVDEDLTVTVVGPKELANEYAVDEIAVVRARQHAFIERVQQAAGTLPITDPRDFDAKMEVLREVRPDQLAAIGGLADGLRSDWRTALAFERELGDTIPTIHQALEGARLRILTRVAALMLASVEPWA
ncbi:MAG: hypothetical protein AAB333_04220, partial [Pseudomonadota bacterium]